MRTISSTNGFVYVEVSDSAINKIHCEEDITNIVFPQERQVDVRTENNDIFVRFAGTGRGDSFLPPMPDSVNPDMDLPTHTNQVRKLPPMEMYVYCGLDAYSLALVPVESLVPYIVNLESSGATKKEAIRKREAALPYEAMILNLIKSAYHEEPPSMYEVRPINKPVADFMQGDLIKASEWIGDRHAVSIYLFTSTIQAKLEFTESQFRELEPRPLAIAMTHQTVNPGETIRIFIVRSLAHGN